jgi:hypothetical protein
MGGNGSFDAKEFDHCKVIDPKLDANGKPSANPLVIVCPLYWPLRGGVYRIRGHLLGLSSRGAESCLQVLQDAMIILQASER